MSSWNQPSLVGRGRFTSIAPAVLLALVTLAPSPAAVAQSVPAAPQPAAPSFASKCTSCVSSLGGILASSKQSCCNSPLGALINGAFQPIKFATGGVIPSPCPGPGDPSHKPGTGTGAGTPGPPGPEQAAEAIKQDQAQAKARAKAVRYLATVPCHYYPEAEVALITALRTDRSECVRWEAAHALAQGCCCTKRTIEALKITVEASQKDSNPREMSMRVRVEAMNALQHCLTMCGDTVDTPQRPEAPAGPPETIPTPPTPKRPETPATYNVAAGNVAADSVNGAGTVTAVQTASYYDQLDSRPTHELLAEARQLVESARPARVERVETPRGRSLFELWQRASEPAAPRGTPTLAAPVAPTNLDQRDQPTPRDQPVSTVSILRRPAVQTRPDMMRTNPPPADLTRASRLGAPLFATPPVGSSAFELSQRPLGSVQHLPLESTQSRFAPPPFVARAGSMNRTRDTAFKPSDQWMYPPLQPPISTALRLEELRLDKLHHQTTHQRQSVWR